MTVFRSRLTRVKSSPVIRDLSAHREADDGLQAVALEVDAKAPQQEDVTADIVRIGGLREVFQ